MLALETGELYVSKSKLNRTDKKMELIEVLLALYAHHSINLGKVIFPKLVDSFERLLNVDLGNVYRVVQAMRIWKKDRALYLHQLIKSVEKDMNNADLFSV